MNHTMKTRRKFIQLGAAGVAASIFGSLPKINFVQTTSDNNKGIVVYEDERIHILTRRKVPITIKISKRKDRIDNISFCIKDMIPG